MAEDRDNRPNFFLEPPLFQIQMKGQPQLGVDELLSVGMSLAMMQQQQQQTMTMMQQQQLSRFTWHCVRHVTGLTACIHVHCRQSALYPLQVSWNWRCFRQRALVYRRDTSCGTNCTQSRTGIRLWHVSF